MALPWQADTFLMAWVGMDKVEQEYKLQSHRKLIHKSIYLVKPQIYEVSISRRKQDLEVVEVLWKPHHDVDHQLVLRGLPNKFWGKSLFGLHGIEVGRNE